MERELAAIGIVFPSAPWRSNGGFLAHFILFLFPRRLSFYLSFFLSFRFFVFSPFLFFSFFFLTSTTPHLAPLLCSTEMIASLPYIMATSSLIPPPYIVIDVALIELIFVICHPRLQYFAIVIVPISF